MSDAHERDLAGSGIELRSAGPDDHDLVRRVVALATHWRSDVTPHELSPEVDKYHEGWGRPGDIGVLAFRGIAFVGGAYVRQFGPADGAYGYISDEYPELGIGVESGARGHGIGAVLIATIKAKVLEQGGSGISLSVEPDNYARLLYQKMGFDLIEDRGGDLLMLWSL